MKKPLFPLCLSLAAILPLTAAAFSLGEQAPADFALSIPEKTKPETDNNAHPAIKSTAPTTQSDAVLQFGPREPAAKIIGTPLDAIVAIVGNDVVTMSEFTANGASAQKAAAENRAILERLIMEKLLLQAAAKHHVVVGETALNVALEQLKKQGKSLTRAQVRKELTIQKLRQQVANSLVEISPDEVDAELSKQPNTNSTEQVNVVDVLVKTPTPEKVQAVMQYLKTQKAENIQKALPYASFNALGWVTLGRIPADFANVLKKAPLQQFNAPINDSDGVHFLKVIARKNNTNKAQAAAVKFTETDVSHILISVDDNNQASARASIDKIYQDLQRGYDFAQLAAEYSMDRANAQNGGNLGFVRPGQMVDDFEIMMNKTAVGHFSPPFLSPFGYHILKVNTRRDVIATDEEQARAKIRQAIFLRKASAEWDAWLSRLREEAYIEIKGQTRKLD